VPYWPATVGWRAGYKPEGEMRYAVYVTISPAWFDPAEVATAGISRSGSAMPA